MSVAKALQCCLSSIRFRSLLLLLLLAQLSACTTNSAQTNTAITNDSERPTEVDKTPERTTKEEQDESDKVNNSTQTLCVYETTKGIAEVTEIGRNSATFKFYPGDKYFKVQIDEIPLTDLKLEQELKAIARSPISGPCDVDEFELLTTVE